MSRVENTTLAGLLGQMADGDKSAFAAFYRALEKPVFKFIASKMNDPFEANDLLHEVFMDVWRSASKFEGRSTVKTWIFGIAYRKTMDHFRKHKRISVTNDIPDQVDLAPDAVTYLVADQEATQLRHCLNGLKLGQRSAIELAFFEDMTYGQISEIAGVPEGTIKTRIFHAKKLLLRCLQQVLGEVAP